MAPNPVSSSTSTTDRTPPDRSAGRPWRTIRPGLALAVLCVACYLPATRGGFIWDDEDYVENNPVLRTLDGLRRIWLNPEATPQYYPLVHTSYWIEYRLWGLNPTGYHVTNILLHAVGAILFWRVLVLLGVPGGWLAAAVFAVHPVHVESVAWITERKNVLSGVFYFASALAYLRFALPPADGRPMAAGRRRYAVAICLFAFALLSKTVTCTLPIVLLIAIWWRRRRITWPDVLPLVPFLILGAAFGLMTAWLEKYHVLARGPAWDLSWIERILIAGRALWFYAGKLLIWPFDLTFIYPRWRIDPTAWGQYVFPVSAVLAVSLAWLGRRRIGTGPLAAGLCFVVTLFPALGFFNVYPMRYAFVADHFQYLASAGLIALAVAGAHRLATRLGSPARLVAWCCAIVVVLGLGALTWRQCGAYRDRETIWRHTLRKNPNAFLAHNNLGVILKRRGMVEQAVAHFRKALEIDPGFVESHVNLGTIAQQAGRLDEALGHYRRAVQSQPDDAGAHNNIGTVYQVRGRPDEAAVYYEKAIELRPDHAEAHANLGAVLQTRGDWRGAMAHYHEALRVDPEYVDPQFNLGVILHARGQADAAAARFRCVVKIDPDHAWAHYRLGLIAHARGDFGEAARRYQTARRLLPEFPDVHYNLGVVRASAGRLDDAVADLGEALRLRPDWPEAMIKLARILAAHPDEAVRDPDRAIQLARRACDLTDARDARALDALAVAYAAAERWDEATAAAESAQAIARTRGDDTLADQIGARLRSYPPSPPNGPAPDRPAKTAGKSSRASKRRNVKTPKQARLTATPQACA